MLLLVMDPSENSFAQLDSLSEDLTQPYSSLLSTISLQNATLQKLQGQHQLLSQKISPENTDKEDLHDEVSREARNATRLKTKRHEKNLFLEEALSVKQGLYEEQFESKKAEMMEEIRLMYLQVCKLREGREGRTNLFAHLDTELFTTRSKKA